MIHGLEQRMRAPRLGVIRLGVVVGTGPHSHPQEVPHFVVPPEIAAVHGDAPVRLPVRFPWSEPERVLHSINYELRRGRSVVRRCDGERYTEIAPAGKDSLGACQRDRENIYAPCPEKCRARAKLSVIVPHTKPLGIWEISVGGIQRIADLLAELRLYYAALSSLTQFPFELIRVPTQEQYYKLGGDVAWRTGYPVRLRCPYTVEEVVALQEARGLPVALPPAPHDDDVVDADEDGNGHTPEVAPVVTPAVRLEAPPVAPLPSPPPEEEAPWEISLCFKTAAACGVSTDLYERYLQAVYHHAGGDLPDADVATEAARLRGATTDQERMLLKAELIRALNAALKQKRG